MSYLWRLLTIVLLYAETTNSKRISRVKRSNTGFPATFDLASAAWDRDLLSCAENIKAPRQQGSCSLDWAFAAASIIQDTICLKSNGQMNHFLSVEELNNCCWKCSKNPGTCESLGIPSNALVYFMENGLRTRGDFHAVDQGCHREMANGIERIGKNHNRGTMVIGRKTKFERIYRWIMTNGPVIMTMDLYDDFALYKSGVYRRNEKSSMARGGSHAVKVIGWGTESVGTERIDYWLCVNSWGPKWGMNGMFKIERGTNTCDCERNGFIGLKFKCELDHKGECV